MTARSPLAEVRPGALRWAGAAAAAVATAVLAWAGGVPTGRAVLLGAAMAVVVLALRLGSDDDAGWPQPAPRRTRPGRHTVVVTLRQLEAAVADPGERALLQQRLAVLEAGGPHPAAHTVREATGLPSRRPSDQRTAPTDDTRRPS